jgi:hypothetical protein
VPVLSHASRRVVVVVAVMSFDLSPRRCSLKFATRCMEVSSKRQGDVQTMELYRLKLELEDAKEEIRVLKQEAAVASGRK